MPVPLLRCAFVLMLSLGAGHAGARSPRDTADAIAAAIERDYYDAARGAEIAALLRAAAVDGRFDAATDPRELATALTTMLASHDGHFHVEWSAPDPTTATPPAAAGRASATPAVDTGVRRVETLPGNIGLLELAFFAGIDFDDDGAPARRAIDAALQLLAWHDAVIIDLRQNGGGAPTMVGYLTSAFTPPGADIYNTFRYRRGTRSEAPDDWHPAPRLDVPLYVLVSGRTGSAAEAFAYTLKNAKRATIVGERSAGAANPGGPVDAGDGWSVFVSDGSPVSPITGTNWEGDGVVPDVEVPAPDALRAAQRLALRRVLAADANATPARWALELMDAEDAYRTGTGDAITALDALVGTYGDLRIVRDGARLVLRQGRRPPRIMLPLAGGAFGDVADPSRRVVFDRAADGRVIALEQQFADGSERRFVRAGDE